MESAIKDLGLLQLRQEGSSPRVPVLQHPSCELPLSLCERTGVGSWSNLGVNGMNPLLASAYRTAHQLRRLLSCPLSSVLRNVAPASCRHLSGGDSGILPTKPAPVSIEKPNRKPQEQELADERSPTLKGVRGDSIGTECFVLTPQLLVARTRAGAGLPIARKRSSIIRGFIGVER